MNPRNSDTNATRRAHVLRMERIENRFAEMMESDFEYLAEADRPMEGPTLWRILGDGSTMRTRFLEGDAITGFCECETLFPTVFQEFSGCCSPPLWKICPLPPPPLGIDQPYL